MGVGRHMAGLATAAAFAALLAAPAVAGPFHLTLHSGGLRVSSPSQRAKAARVVQIAVTVIDARGTGAGWTLRLVSTARVSVERIVATCANGSTCTLPRAAHVSVRGGVLHAARGSGMGVIRLLVTLGPLARDVPAPPVLFAIG
jgi:hypothetical protein